MKFSYKEKLQFKSALRANTAICVLGPDTD